MREKTWPAYELHTHRLNASSEEGGANRLAGRPGEALEPAC